MGAAPICIEVPSSWQFIWKSPSPAKQMTVRSGCTIFGHYQRQADRTPLHPDCGRQKPLVGAVAQDTCPFQIEKVPGTVGDESRCRPAGHCR